MKPILLLVMVSVTLLAALPMFHVGKLRGAPPPSQAAPAVASVKPDRGTPGKVRIRADARGHFVTQAKLNRKPVRVLVDTGASSVAINRSLARRLGIRLRDRDFTGQASTANGIVPIAPVTLRSVRIGQLELRDVEAMVLPDASLDGVLLGMSFLKRLRRFEVKRGEMHLVR